MLAVRHGIVLLVRGIRAADLPAEGAVSCQSHNATVEIPVNELIPLTDDEDTTVVASEEDFYWEEKL